MIAFYIYITRTFTLDVASAAVYRIVYDLRDTTRCYPFHPRYPLMVFARLLREWNQCRSSHRRGERHRVVGRSDPAA
jgi:hypothetical protein